MQPVARRRGMRARTADGPKRVLWRPSKRNAVMKRALQRPNERLRQDVGEPCFCCSEGTMRREAEPPHRGTQFSLQVLGIKVYRWYRNFTCLCCDSCGTTARDGDWGVAKVGRKWADFGVTKFPLPRRVEGKKRRRTDKSLVQRLIAQLHPRKRALVNLKVGRALTRRDKRLARVQRWSFIRRGEVPPYDGY